MLLFLCSLAACKSGVATGYYDPSGAFRYELELDRENGDCWVEFNDDLNTSGWYILNLEGRPGLDGRQMGRCVGFLEGVLTHDRFLQSFYLFKDQIGVSRTNPEDPKLLRLRAFYTDHLRWMRQSIEAYPDDLYWRQVSVVFNIFEGLHEGLNQFVSPPLDELDVYLMVGMGDSLELQASWDWIPMYDEVLSRCTGMIQMGENDEDIYFAHDSWTDYRSLHAVIKNYNLPCDEFISPRVSLSTQLGLISSVDDWFINERGLLVLETTFTLQNRSLYTSYVTPKSVMNWLRTVLGMFTAENVTQYEDQFLRHNSGTYNNDYYVVDTKKLRYGKRAEKDLVHSIAQLPGPFRWIEDLTEELYREGFILSFNVPKNKAASDFMQFERAYGVSSGFCNYTECCRYLIAKRESPRLRKWDMFQHFMRYGGYKRDLFSLWQGKPNHGCVISSRGDTDDDVALQNTHGGINTKAVRASEALTRMHMHLINSPSYEQNPVLNWSNYPMSQFEHDGLPEIWNFDWIELENPGFDYCAQFDKETCKDTNFCGWCNSAKKCMPGDRHGPFFNEKCARGWSSLGSPDYLWMYIAFPLIAVAVIALVIGGVWFSRRKSPEQGIPVSTVYT